MVERTKLNKKAAACGVDLAERPVECGRDRRRSMNLDIDTLSLPVAKGEPDDVQDARNRSMALLRIERVVAGRAGR
jgi:hypothetical protein